MTHNVETTRPETLAVPLNDPNSAHLFVLFINNVAAPKSSKKRPLRAFRVIFCQEWPLSHQIAPKTQDWYAQVLLLAYATVPPCWTRPFASGKRDPSGGVRGGLHQLECIFMGNQSFPHLLARRPHVNPTAGELVPVVCAVLFVPGLRAPEQPDEAAEPGGRRAIRTADPADPGRPRRWERHGELGRLALRHLSGGRLDATWQRSEQGDGKEEEKLEKLHVVVIIWE